MFFLLYQFIELRTNIIIEIERIGSYLICDTSGQYIQIPPDNKYDRTTAVQWLAP